LKWVKVVYPAILLHILFLLVSLGYHPASLKVANGMVRDKPGIPCKQVALLLQDYSSSLNYPQDPGKDNCSKPLLEDRS